MESYDEYIKSHGLINLPEEQNKARYLGYWKGYQEGRIQYLLENMNFLLDHFDNASIKEFWSLQETDLDSIRGLQGNQGRPKYDEDESHHR